MNRQPGKSWNDLKNKERLEKAKSDEGKSFERKVISRQVRNDREVEAAHHPVTGKQLHGDDKTNRAAELEGDVRPRKIEDEATGHTAMTTTSEMEPREKGDKIVGTPHVPKDKLRMKQGTMARKMTPMAGPKAPGLVKSELAPGMSYNQLKMQPVQAQDDAGTSVIQDDPSRPFRDKIDQATEKAKSFRERLKDIRHMIKPECKCEGPCTCHSVMQDLTKE